MESQLRAVTQRIYSQLAPWDKVQLARHPARPYTLDFIRMIFDDFLELHGDRTYGDDPAIVGGLAVLNGEPVMVIGHQKGRDIKERSLRNFGSARPEGYRKAVRLLKLAQKSGRPVVSFIDTPAADCSVGAEERGISEAIARSMMEMSGIRVPIVVAITGEGGSGGAIATAVGDRILMLNGQPLTAVDLSTARFDAPVLLLLQDSAGTTRHVLIDPWATGKTIRPVGGANVLDPNVVLF